MATEMELKLIVFLEESVIALEVLEEAVVMTIINYTYQIIVLFLKVHPDQGNVDINFVKYFQTYTYLGPDHLLHLLKKNLSLYLCCNWAQNNFRNAHPKIWTYLQSLLSKNLH